MHGRVTNGLKVGWVAPLAFYDHKLATLHKLEASGVLHHFFVTEKDTGARVGPQHHELRVGARGILAVLFPPENSATSIVDAIAEVSARLSPLRLRSMSVFTQHVFPLDLTYERGRTALTRSVVGSAIGDRPGADSGVMFECDSDAGHVNYQYGVVNPAELAELLLGGALPAHPPRDAMSGRTIPKDLALASLYIEASHQVRTPDSKLDDAAKFVLDNWRNAVQHADETAVLLSEHFHGMAEQEGSSIR